MKKIISPWTLIECFDFSQQHINRLFYNTQTFGIFNDVEY